ncbi:MAG: fatty acid--CoA ligase family protein [Hyphomicrobiales bacterium]
MGHQLFSERFFKTATNPVYAERIAIRAAGQSLTYGALLSHVVARCDEFQTQGIGDHGPVGRVARIALLQTRSLSLCIDIVSCICAGISVTILSRGDATQQSIDKLKTISATRLIADDDHRQAAEEISKVLSVPLEIRSSQLPILEKASLSKVVKLPKTPSPEREALVIFTSGSTGMPKGVAISQANVASNIYGVSSETGITGEDHFLQVMPLSHTNGLQNQLIMPLTVGASVTLCSHFDAQKFIDQMAEYQPTVFTAVPTMLQRMLPLEIPARALAKLRMIRSGAAQLAPEVQTQIEKHFGTKVVVSYGQTEATCTNTANSLRGRKIGSVGRALAGQEVAIIGLDDAALLKAGEIGEVCIRGANIAMGFIGEPPFDHREWYHTGDCGYLDDEGYLFLTGRLKDIIIRGGANLSPRQIEDVLLQHKTINAAYVCGVPDSDLGEVPVGFVEASGDAIVNLAEINQHIVECLGRSHQLSKIFKLEQLPTNEVGKIDSKALRRFTEKT